ncbi:MAG: ribosome maturation factor RimP [Clostridia bacterium]|nr:ribosome maturation factor RimP [Clostridia bacterium]
MKFKSTEEISAAISGIAEKMNVEIFGIEAKVGKEPHVTVYADTEDGIDLDTLEKFHNAIDPILDEIDVSYGSPYTLNVSSPGLDRPLKTDRDFERKLGCDVELKLYKQLKGKKYFEGKLVGYDGKNVVIEFENGETEKFSLTMIAKINEAVIF